MRRSKIAVIGLGNRLLADEGAGLYAIELLCEKFRPGQDLDLVEAGTPGMNLLHQFDEREKIIFIDAGNCGMKPGEYRRFVPGDVISRKKSPHYSLHEFDLVEFLEFARQMGITKNIEVVIYCIQAAEMKMSQQLSTVVKKKLPRLVEDVYREVKEGRRLVE